MRNILIITSLLFLAQAKPCRAEYGWPPVPYDVSTWCDCHGRHARRLCEIIRDLRCRLACRCKACLTCPICVEQKSPSPAHLLPPIETVQIQYCRPEPVRRFFGLLPPEPS